MTTDVLFQRAVRYRRPVSMAIAGPTGSGKTYGALRLAYGLTGDWDKIFMVNLDPPLNGVGYAGDPFGEYRYYQFEPPFDASRLIRVLKAAEREGAGAIIIDTLTHVWAGQGGLREVHDLMPGNSFANWAKVNPIWDALIEYLTVGHKVHVISCIRSNMTYELEQVDESGRTKLAVKIVGLTPTIRPNTEYEFPLFVTLRRDDHRADILTQRGNMIPQDLIALDGTIELTEELGQALAAWVDQGVEGEAPKPAPVPAPEKPQAQRNAPAQGGGNGQGGHTGKGNVDGANSFWSAVYMLAASLRITRDEARADANKILEQNAGDYNAAFEAIKVAWDVQDGDPENQDTDEALDDAPGDDLGEALDDALDDALDQELDALDI